MGRHHHTWPARVTTCATTAILVLALGNATPAANGSGEHRLAVRSASIQSAKPVDGRIAFASGGQIYTINPDGTALEQVTHFRAAFANSANWSPDGTHIAFQLFPGDFSFGQVATIKADGTGLHKITHDGIGYYDAQPSYSPNGRRILYTRCRPDPPGGCAIYTIAVDGTGAVGLTHYRHGIRAGGDFVPKVSPNGQSVVFQRSEWKGTAAEIWMMNIDGSEAHLVTPNRLQAAFPEWSPDGRHLYFHVANNSGFGFHIFRSTPSGSHITQLTFTEWPDGDFTPSASPSGKSIAFFSDRRYPDACCNDLFTMNADGSRQVRVPTDGLFVGAPDWGSAPLESGPTHVSITSPTAAQQRIAAQLAESPKPWSRAPVRSVHFR